MPNKKKNINHKVVELDNIVVKFAGDSGDGMQLTGALFSDATALAGNDFATFPDYPSEIRAPHGTVAGVSGFQIHIGHNDIYTTGDLADILVAMNPASLKTNLKWLKRGTTIIVDVDSFDQKSIAKAGYETNPLEDNSLDDYKVIEAPISSLTKNSISDLDINFKEASKSRNMFALGMMYFLFDRDLKPTVKFFEQKFGSNPVIVEANKKVLQAGYNYAETIQAISTFSIEPAKLKRGTYRNITGNIATAWGLLAAAERSGLELFLGSYPITPASEILQELSKHKQFNAKVFQAEDEIAGICSAIGASYTGSLAVTTTSGPGFSLKSEAIGLAVITEIPLVIVNVQRGGPSTGLPTKSEQSDLMQALYGRNGECPAIVIAASSPSNCFYYAYIAAKISVEHMTPVILLTDGYLANGSEVFKIPKVVSLPDINPPIVGANDKDYKPYKRDDEKLSRRWAIPGTEGLRHRIGGLEKADITGNVSHDPENHQKMSIYRAEKVKKVANYIPDQEIFGKKTGDLLVVSWGGTYGVMHEAVQEVQRKNKKVSMAHFNYINPLPKNTEKILSSFNKVIVCENNLGQFVDYLKINFPHIKYYQYNKIQGLPFMITELVDKFNEILDEK